MLLFYIIILNAISMQSDCTTLLPEYAQCNGAKWPSVKECRPGMKCQKKDEWYSQCLKSCPDAWECKQTECSDPNKCTNSFVVSEYGQCGGVNHKGSTRCADGLACFKNNKWYSQCLKRCPCGWQCCGNCLNSLFGA